jgi:hypothetical protein
MAEEMEIPVEELVGSTPPEDVEDISDLRRRLNEATKWMAFTAMERQCFDSMTRGKFSPKDIAMEHKWPEKRADNASQRVWARLRKGPPPAPSTVHERKSMQPRCESVEKYMSQCKSPHEYAKDHGMSVEAARKLYSMHRAVSPRPTYWRKAALMFASLPGYARKRAMKVSKRFGYLLSYRLLQTWFNEMEKEHLTQIKNDISKSHNEFEKEKRESTSTRRNITSEHTRTDAGGLLHD